MVVTKREEIEIHKIAKKYNLSYKEVEHVIQSQYEFIRSVVTKLNLPRNLTEEEFKKQTKNFNIPSIGKLYASYTVYKRINKINEESTG